MFRVRCTKNCFHSMSLNSIFRDSIMTVLKRADAALRAVNNAAEKSRKDFGEISSHRFINCARHVRTLLLHSLSSRGSASLRRMAYDLQIRIGLGPHQLRTIAPFCILLRDSGDKHHPFAGAEHWSFMHLRLRPLCALHNTLPHLSRPTWTKFTGL